MRLRISNHDRDAAGLTYVYPVVSRRSRGVSVGINLNPNNACNWRCIYCQVPGLVKGAGPTIDLARLETELRSLLDDVVNGDFMQSRVPEGLRRLNDVALSGNGESTTSPDFERVVTLVGKVLGDLDLIGSVKVVLITNGSMVGREAVDRGLQAIAGLGGEVWFKLDAATREGLSRINSTSLSPERHLGRLRRSAELCPTYVQTCVFALDGEPPSPAERSAYVNALGSLVEEGVPLKGVLLYGLARESHQPEAERLSALSIGWLQELASQIEARGLSVTVSA